MNFGTWHAWVYVCIEKFIKQKLYIPFMWKFQNRCQVSLLSNTFRMKKKNKIDKDKSLAGITILG